MTPRILVLSASVGTGHNRAAQALQLALRQLRPDAHVEYCDILDQTNRAFRRVYGRTYFSLVESAPYFVGYLYDRLDRPVKLRQVDRMRLSLSMMNLHRLIDRLTSSSWDLAICTHFLPAEVIANLRKSGRVNFPQATVTTDFDTHRLWVNSPCEHFFAASEEGRLNLAAWGVPVSDISVFGIPVHPVFSEFKSASECRQRLDLGSDRPIVLQMSGGAGFGPAVKVHREILAVQVPLEIISVAGRNASLKSKLENIPCPPRHRRRVMGFTDQIDELMAASDVVVSKPGGLTVAESLARGAAMCIIDPIPGQETRNSDYLLENGAAIKVNSLTSLAFKLESLLKDRSRLDQLRSNARRLARPHAAIDIAKKCLDLVGSPCPEAMPRNRMSEWFSWKSPAPAAG